MLWPTISTQRSVPSYVQEPQIGVPRSRFRKCAEAGDQIAKRHAAILPKEAEQRQRTLRGMAGNQPGRLAWPHGWDAIQAAARIRIGPVALGGSFDGHSGGGGFRRWVGAFPPTRPFGELWLVRLCAAQRYDLPAARHMADAAGSGRRRVVHCRVGVARVRLRMGTRSTPCSGSAKTTHSVQPGNLKSGSCGPWTGRLCHPCGTCTGLNRTGPPHSGPSGCSPVDSVSIGSTRTTRRPEESTTSTEIEVTLTGGTR